MNQYEKDGALRLTDMVQNTIIVHEQCLINQAYEEILKITTFEVIRIENHMMEPYNPYILLNVIYNNSIIGEIIIRKGDRPANFYTLKFLSDLSNSYNVLEFQEHIWNRCDHLQSDNKFYKREILPEPVDTTKKEKGKEEKEKIEKETPKPNEGNVKENEKTIPLDKDDFLTPNYRGRESRGRTTLRVNQHRQRQSLDEYPSDLNYDF